MKHPEQNDVRPEEEPDVLVCEECGSKENVQKDFDPYALEINDKEIEVTLCADCYQERVWDI